MSDASASELHIDVAAFLPEGVELDTSGPEVDADPQEQSAVTSEAASPAPPVDLEALDQVERDLAAVDAAIAALDAGSYGLDPATGEPIDDALLAEDPTRLS